MCKKLIASFKEFSQTRRNTSNTCQHKGAVITRDIVHQHVITLMIIGNDFTLNKLPTTYSTNNVLS